MLYEVITLVNELGVNSTYTVLYAIYSMRHEENAGRIYPHMDETEIIQRVRDLRNNFV